MQRSQFRARGNWHDSCGVDCRPIQVWQVDNASCEVIAEVLFWHQHLDIARHWGNKTFRRKTVVSQPVECDYSRQPSTSEISPLFASLIRRIPPVGIAGNCHFILTWYDFSRGTTVVINTQPYYAALVDRLKGLNTKTIWKVVELSYDHGDPAAGGISSRELTMQGNEFDALALMPVRSLPNGYEHLSTISILLIYRMAERPRNWEEG